MGLDVEVQNLHVAPLMEVVDASGDAQGHLAELLDSEHASPVGREDVLVERAIGHVLVDECSLRSLRAKPDQTHHVDVVDPANRGDLTDEVLAVELGAANKHLDGDRVFTKNVSFVHRTKAALSQFFSEVARHGYDVAVGVACRS